MVDGGYLKHACFICPQNQRCDTSSVYWSELVESVRKDIECVFGILKATFRILRSYRTFKHPSTMEAIFQCCCILHNMLLVHDGLDTKYNDECFWNKLNPIIEEEIDEIVLDENVSTYQSTNHSLYLPDESIDNQLVELSIVQWELDKLKIYCMSNMMDLITLNYMKKSLDGFSVGGDTYLINGPLDFYQQRFNELYHLDSA